MASPKRAIRWGIFALGLSTFLMVAKFGAYLATGSAAVLSDALESTVNIVTSSFALFAVWLSAQPRDSEHPYGHGRVEYIASTLEAVALGVAGISIILVTATRYQQGAAVTEPGEGSIYVTAIAVFALLGGSLLIRMGRKLDSDGLVSDGVHIRADAYTTIGTLVALLLVEITGNVNYDFIVSFLIGGWLCIHGLMMFRSSAEKLMDRADPELLEQIAEMLEEVREPGWIAPHRTKVHRLGQEIHVDIHMVFPRYWDLEKTHQCANRLEAALERTFGARSDMMVHMEPCTDRGCSTCDKEDCPIRKAPFEGREPWTGETIASVERR
jgi:cation diffusion facilitator family transporter